MAALTRFALFRFARGALTLWFAVSVTFLLVRLLPGDPVLAVADPGMTEAAHRELLHAYGLDRPLWVQYGAYLRALAHGNLGVSIRQQAPVLDVLAERLPWTLLLTGSALVLTLLAGIPLGVLAAVRANGAFDRAVQVFSVLGQSMFVPTAGIVLLYGFGLLLGWLPIGGAVDRDTHGFGTVLSVARHLLLPAASLMLVQVGSYVLTVRTTLIDCLREEYCDLARAKGVRPGAIVWKHALRNALLPVTTLVGLQLGFLVSGAVLTETIFAYPGVGRAIFEAVGQLDYPVLQGAFVVLAATVVVANLLTDIAYGLLDPRVRIA